MHLTHPCSTLSLCPTEHKVTHCHWLAAFVSLLHLSSFSRASLLTTGTLLLQGSIVSHPRENHLFASLIGWHLSRPWSLVAAMLLGFFASRRVGSGRWQVGEVLQKMTCCLSRGPGKRRGIRRGWWEMRGNGLPWSPVKRLQLLLSAPCFYVFRFLWSGSECLTISARLPDLSQSLLEGRERGERCVRHPLLGVV